MENACCCSAPRPFQIKRRPESGRNCLPHLNMPVGHACALGATSFSFIACAWLLVHLYRVPANVRNRLSLLQIRYLALADLFFVISNVPPILVGVVNLRTETLENMCKFNFSNNVSLWIEMHFAASAVLQCFKVQALQALRWALYLIWVPGLFCRCVPLSQNPGRTIRRSVSACRRLSEELTNPLDVAGLALCICAGSYVTSWMQHSPCSVQGRASRKVAVYLVNALRTYGPMFACFVDGKLFSNLTVLTRAWIFELLGGLFNTFTCAMQSRYAPALFGQSTLVRDNPTALQRHSFNVAFVDDVEAADTDAVNSWPSLLWQSNSFRIQWSTFTNIETPFAADLEVGNSRFLFLRQS